MSTLNPIHVLGKRVALYQLDGAFRSSIDAVLLAAACPAKPGQRVLDLGCGIGTAGFCVLARVEGAELTGIDIQGDHTEMAAQNARLNGITERCRFTAADIRTYRDLQDGKNRLFDHVICNPPYNEAAHYTKAATPAKSAAMALDSQTTLKDWVDCANRNIKAGGSVSMVHMAEKLDQILAALDGRFGAVEVFPFWPKAGHPAKRVVVRARKDRKSGLSLHAGITLHEEGGSYTQEAEAILRGMKPL